jgi:hypothetical protein
MLRNLMAMLFWLACAGTGLAASDAEKRAFVIEMADGLKMAPDKPTRAEGLDQCYRVYTRISVEAPSLQVGTVAEMAMYAAVSDCIALMFELGGDSLAQNRASACTFLAELEKHVEGLKAGLQPGAQATSAQYPVSVAAAAQTMGCNSAAPATAQVEADVLREIEDAQFQMFTDATQAASRCNGVYTALAIGSGKDIPHLPRSSLSAQAAMCVALSVQLGGASPQTMLRGICEAVNAAIRHYNQLLPAGGGVAAATGPLLKTAREMAHTHNCPPQ